MEGTAQTLYWFQNESVKVEVPFFQRPYVWDEVDWDELIESINSANENSMPFIGSFILQKLTDRYYVIDGQQRITTLSVLIKAFLDTFDFTYREDIRPQFVNIIYATSLYGLKSVYTTRLIPSNVDKADFEAVMSIDGDDLSNKSGRIVKAYKHFVKYFSSCGTDVLENFGAKLLTSKKFFITIILDLQDDEQKIFDSVNSLGKDLTKADIIKNYLYQKMKEAVNNDPSMVDQILKHHDKYWLQTFYDSEEKRQFWENQKPLGRVQTNNLEAFLKDFAIVKGFYSAYNTGGLSGLAKAYKTEINKQNYSELIAFSKELSEYADCYYTYNSEYAKMDDFKISDVINTTLLILDILETTTFNPYILKVIKENPDDLNEKLFALQRFIFMRYIYKAKTKNYNKICDVLLDSNNEIEYLNGYDDESFDTTEYPAGLKRITNKPATLVLFVLELIRRNGEEKSYSDTMKYSLSLEHIMPQKWEKNWSKVSSYQYDEIKKDYVIVTDYNDVVTNRKKAIYSIGNMTLLTANLNSKLGNASFSEKIKGNASYSGYEKYSGNLSVAKEIVNIHSTQGNWDERNIYRRCLEIFSELNEYYKFTTSKIEEC